MTKKSLTRRAGRKPPLKMKTKKSIQKEKFEPYHKNTKMPVRRTMTPDKAKVLSSYYSSNEAFISNEAHYREMTKVIKTLSVKTLEEAANKFYELAKPERLSDKRLSAGWENRFRKRLIEINVLNPEAPKDWRLEQGQMLIDGKIWNGKKFIEVEVLAL